jgi:hypothetical protein
VARGFVQAKALLFGLKNLNGLIFKTLTKIEDLGSKWSNNSKKISGAAHKTCYT